MTMRFLRDGYRNRSCTRGRIGFDRRGMSRKHRFGRSYSASPQMRSFCRFCFRVICKFPCHGRNDGCRRYRTPRSSGQRSRWRRGPGNAIVSQPRRHGSTRRYCCIRSSSIQRKESPCTSTRTWTHTFTRVTLRPSKCLRSVVSVIICGSRTPPVASAP